MGPPFMRPACVQTCVHMLCVLVHSAHAHVRAHVSAHLQRVQEAHVLDGGDLVEDALHVGKTYKLQTREKGKFGRFLGVIFISDKTSINAALVTEHLAVAYHGQSKTEVQDAHAANYQILKDKGLL